MATRTFCKSASPMISLRPLGASSSSYSSSCCALTSRAGYGRISSFHFSSAPCSQRTRHPFFLLHVVAEEVEAVTGLTMNIKVEGTLTDSLIPKVTDALKNVEGVSNVKVYSSEGVATVELEKLTTIQATGEASSLLEKIQGEGFKLQNLCISFDDTTADIDDNIAYEYESAL